MAGEVLLRAQVANSLDTQAHAIDWAVYPLVGSRPGVPNSEGRTAVKPASSTRRPKSATSGVIPGISVMTMTAGPLPRRNT